MTTPALEEVIEQIVAKDSRYDRLAYVFVSMALAYTQTKIASQDSESNHANAQQLLEGIREYAFDQYGTTSRLTLNSWGIYSCRDFGEIIFKMVDYKLVEKTPNENRSDFDNGYDFKSAFPEPFYRNRAFLVICILFVCVIVGLLLTSK